jgi:Transposase DDE domain
VQGSGHKRAREACPREKQSRARARQERQERLEKSLEELEKLRTLKAARSPHKRVSIADPEARIMKQPDGGLALSYNAQLSTDASHGLIVGVRVTQAASDWEQIVAGAGTDRSKAAAAAEADCCGRGLHDARRDRGNGGTPDGFSGQHAPRRCEQRANCPHRLPPSAFLFQSETHRYVCPEGKFLYHEGRLKNERGLVSRRYLARAKDCQACVRKPECCPENRGGGRGILRLEESAAVLSFRQKMATEPARASYRRRGRVPEFCNAWIKSKLGLRQFHVRGLGKVQIEMLWAGLTYNLQQWVRLRRVPPQPA